MVSVGPGQGLGGPLVGRAAGVPVGKRCVGWHCSVAGRGLLPSRRRDDALFFFPRQQEGTVTADPVVLVEVTRQAVELGAVGPSGGEVCV